LSDAELAEALDLAQSAGVTTVDFEASWPRLDQDESSGSKQTYDWHHADRLVRASEARGMRVTFLLTQTPDWVHPYLQETVANKDDRTWYAAKGSTELQHWSNFVRDVVERYRGRVTHYEIWNEPNLVDFWKPRPDVNEYIPLLREAYLSAKKTDPDAKIVFGGLSKNDLGYLNEYYRVINVSYPEAASHDYFFDVLGVHPYSNDRSPDRYTPDAIYQGEYGAVNENFLGFACMKEVMENQGDSEKNLFLSEYGFTTVDTSWMKAVPDSRRALYLKRAYELARDIPYLEGLSWYAYYPGFDAPQYTLVDENFNPSLTFRAYKQVTGAEVSNVAVTINVPDSVSGTHAIDPQLNNLSNSDISRWELWVDGALVGEQPAAPINWDVQDAEAGVHEVMVAAYTTEGSVWHSNIVKTNVVYNYADCFTLLCLLQRLLGIPLPGS